MRLHHKGAGIDVAQTSEMVDIFLDAGFTYFDTAFIYPGSENVCPQHIKITDMLDKCKETF
jgi:predicted aldo/keto reductase-like oxidoreductase